MSVPDPFYLRFLILARKVSVPFPDVRSRDFVREPRQVLEQREDLSPWRETTIRNRAVQTFLLLETSRDVLGNVYRKDQAGV
jgi:hypothetical protein